MIFQSLRSRILATVAGIVFVAAVTIMYFAQTEVQKAMDRTHDDNARNLIRTAALKVENQYKSILFHKRSALEIKKEELKNIASVVINIIEYLYNEFKLGRITEKQARLEALKEIKKLRYSNGVGYVWINDTQRPFPLMIMHPTLPELEGRILDDPIYANAYGKEKNLFQAFVDVCLEKGSGFVDYRWPKPTPEGLSTEQPKISFVVHYKPWDWVVGTGLYLDDIEAYEKQRYEAALEELTESFSQVRLGESGYMFLFNGQKQVLIHPVLKGVDVSRAVNPATNNLILDDLIEAAKNPGKPYEYLWDKPPLYAGEYRFWKRAFLIHFEPLDWYLCATVYKADARQPVQRVVRKLKYVAVLFFIVAFFIALWLSRSLSRPLDKLANTAKEIEESGIDSVSHIPTLGTLETRKLGTILDKMLHSLRDSNRQLRKERDFNKELLRTSPVFVVTMGVDGKVIMMNDTMLAALGYSHQEVQGKDFFHFVIPDGEREKVSTLLNSMLAEQGITQGENHILTKDKRELLVEWHNSRITGANGEVEFIFGVGIDITERKRTEEMMIITEKMLTVGGLAAGMAHEINNPLGIILQGVQNTIRRISPDLDKNIQAADEIGVKLEDVRTYLEKRNIMKYFKGMQEAGNRAAKIVRSMLNFSRQGEPSVMSAVDINRMLDDTIELADKDFDLRKKYDFRNIEIRRDYAEQLPVVPCSRSEIEQVILNLLKNAAQATAGGKSPGFKPQITLTTRRVEQYVSIEVADNGPGMDEQTRKRVFEPFFTTKRVGSGTGLGLSVSYFIITNNHRGRISVRSAPGKGAAFKIFLPLEIKNE